MTETVEFWLPSELAEPAPFAFQFHDASKLPLTPVLVPTVKPSLSKDVKVFVFVSSTPVPLEWSLFVTPLTESNKAWLSVTFLFLIHTQSGWKPTPVMLLVPPLPA